MAAAALSSGSSGSPPNGAPIGFVILSHRDPAQLERLVRRLDELYHRPPIVLHHDTYQCPLPASLETGRVNIEIVRPALRTYWADFSVCKAMMRSIALMYARAPGPEYMTLLSAADYPIATPARVLSDLRSSGADAFIELRPIASSGAASSWDMLCRKRYLRWRWSAGPFSTKLGRATRITLPKWASKYLLPFGAKLPCHAGGTWFTLSRHGALTLLKMDASHPKLRRALRYAPSSDECFIHTLLAGAARQGLIRLDPSPRRYVDWSQGGPHPRTFGPDDVERLLASGDHFARKFDPIDTGTLDALNARIGPDPAA